ncbi:hypothetical protein D3C71_2231820 [compost metagenome]
MHNVHIDRLLSIGENRCQNNTRVFRVAPVFIIDRQNQLNHLPGSPTPKSILHSRLMH